MKVCFNSVLKNSYYNTCPKIQENSCESKKYDSKEFPFHTTYSYPVFKANNSSSPILSPVERRRLNELNKAEELFKDENGKFSLDKAVDAMKNKIDSQLMLYSEDDIKNVVETVMEENPDVTREDVLNVLSRMSSFSNYNSFSYLENFLKDKNVIKSFALSNQLSVNNVFHYLAGKGKRLISWPMANRSDKRCLIADRNLMENLKKEKQSGNPLSVYSYILDEIQNENLEIVLLDGWEAKTDNGYKSFNAFGAWGDLASAASDIIKAQKNGKDPFNDDIIEDLKYLFGDEVQYTIIKNSDYIDGEKDIAERFNSKTVSKEQIKDFLNGIAGFSTPSQKSGSTNLFSDLENRNREYKRKMTRLELSGVSQKNIKTIMKDYISLIVEKNITSKKSFLPLQEQLAKVLYCSLNVYSPRRMAEELKSLNSEIEYYAESIDKKPEDALYIISDIYKSYSLINYQYSKVNNIPIDRMILVPSHEIRIKPEDKEGKFFVYIDDFSGTGQSLLEKPIIYKEFKKRNPEQPFLFAPLVCTEKAIENLRKGITEARFVLKRPDLKDRVVYAKKTEDIDDYLKLLPAHKKALLRHCFISGFEKGSTNIAFPHIVPDNCSDIAGLFLENLLKSSTANRSNMNDYKKQVILYLIANQNN